MFVGVGASRVRDLFEQAKQNAPCIIFIDEIDAVGRHRGAGLGGGHDEREQTLNQLLVEMDGFEMQDNVIVIAATNRPDILDPALLRPGRFDRQIVVDRPDRRGPQDDPRGARARQAAGQGRRPRRAGRAARRASPAPTWPTCSTRRRCWRRGTARSSSTMTELEEGIMRVIAGPEKKTRIISEKEKAITAYHEMGHALVGHFLEFTDPVHKVSIVSRGQALGYTISLPSEDKFLTTKHELMDTLSMTRRACGRGGRVRRDRPPARPTTSSRPPARREQ